MCREVCRAACAGASHTGGRAADTERELAKEWERNKSVLRFSSTANWSRMQPPASAPARGLRVRLARACDAPAVAAVTAAAFEPAWATAARASGGGPVAAAAIKLQRVTEARVQSQVIEWAETRAAARATARAAAVAPPPSVFATPRELRAAARATAKADETRRTALLLAEDVTTGRVVAALALLRRAAGAALPPPFPSAAPRVAYIASVATDPDHRRRGAARALLIRAASRAAAWGDESVWLHAPRGSSGRAAGANALYGGAGFVEPDGMPGVAPWAAAAGLRVARLEPRRRVCRVASQLAQPLPPPPPPPALSRGARSADGAYVWRVGEED